MTNGIQKLDIVSKRILYKLFILVKFTKWKNINIDNNSWSFRLSSRKGNEILFQNNQMQFLKYQ
jgi:hypothetical protein